MVAKARTLSKQIDSQAETLERDHADDVWRTAAAQHLRSASRFLVVAEQQDEREAEQAKKENEA